MSSSPLRHRGGAPEGMYLPIAVRQHLNLNSTACSSVEFLTPQLLTTWLARTADRVVDSSIVKFTPAKGTDPLTAQRLLEHLGHVVLRYPEGHTILAPIIHSYPVVGDLRVGKAQVT
eukprot:3102458-Amphidinium_carterae.2